MNQKTSYRIILLVIMIVASAFLLFGGYWLQPVKYAREFRLVTGLCLILEIYILISIAKKFPMGDRGKNIYKRALFGILLIHIIYSGYISLKDIIILAENYQGVYSFDIWIGKSVFMFIMLIFYSVVVSLLLCVYLLFFKKPTKKIFLGVVVFSIIGMFILNIVASIEYNKEDLSWGWHDFKPTLIIILLFFLTHMYCLLNRKHSVSSREIM